MLYPSFLTLAAFIVSLIGTRLLIIRLRKSRVFSDVPNERSSHKKPTPKGGGVAVVTTIFMYFFYIDHSNYILLLTLVLLAGVSLLNDLTHINPLARLMSHFFAVIVMLALTDFNLASGFLPPVVDTILLAIGWVWFINLFNFMDGIDGITAAETCAICIGIVLLLAFSGSFEDGLAYQSLLVFGIMCGFWWWNQHPAKIFLGDVGSVPLGFLVGYLLLSLASQGFVAAAIILPAYYIMDATVTLLRRIVEGKSPAQAHREHFYQQAASQIGHHGIVVQLITGLNALLIMLALFSIMNPELAWLHIVLAYVASGIWCMVFLGLSNHIASIQRNRK